MAVAALVFSVPVKGSFLALSVGAFFVSFAQAILYRGAGLSVVWPAFVSLAGIGVVFFLVSLSRFRNSIAAS